MQLAAELHAERERVRGDNMDTHTETQRECVIWRKTARGSLRQLGAARDS